jgi:hypothetical protein
MGSRPSATLRLIPTESGTRAIMIFDNLVCPTALSKFVGLLIAAPGNKGGILGRWAFSRQKGRRKIPRPCRHYELL